MLPLIIAAGSIIVLAYISWKVWSDMPNKYRSFFWCETCQANTEHDCTAYKDVEYRTCLRCHTHTKWEPQAEDKRHLDKKEEKREDRTKQDDDFKRAAKRKYKPRQPKDADQEDN